MEGPNHVTLEDTGPAREKARNNTLNVKPVNSCLLEIQHDPCIYHRGFLQRIAKFLTVMFLLITFLGF